MSISHCMGALRLSFQAPISYALPLKNPNLNKFYNFKKPIFRKLSISAIPYGDPNITCLQGVEELPPKLLNIVKLFETVAEPRSKYEQLLHYGKKMSPLPKEFQTRENKVEGCVSQVWVRAYLNDNKVYFEADSDSVLTKGLAALLVEGLSGCSPAEILAVTPDFVHRLGLKQSLTPSRNNGFLNMLKLMQRKTLQLYMEAQNAGNSKDVGSSGLAANEVLVVEETEQVCSDVGVEEKVNGFDGSDVSSRVDRIRQKLETELEPMVLEIEDVSHQHAGHGAVQDQAGETHFNVKIVSAKFEGRSLVKRHRLVYELLQEELQSGLHALSIVAKTPAETENM
uniref:TSA: Wollemia nobilis Ref_Wollemi_Transcript_26037_1535 transcribed RNA sequence n=1 Tax=Wollemia nobilis TaxID=56998 RepID=A0A0C9QLU8_9CONI